MFGSGNISKGEYTPSYPRERVGLMYSTVYWPIVAFWQSRRLRDVAQPADSELAGASVSWVVGLAVSTWLYGWHGLLQSLGRARVGGL